MPHSIVSTSGYHTHLWVINGSSELQLLVCSCRIAIIETHDEHMIATLSYITDGRQPISNSASKIAKHVAKMTDTNLSEYDYCSLSQPLATFKDMFHFDASTAAQTSMVEHQIDTGDTPSVESSLQSIAPRVKNYFRTH